MIKAILTGATGFIGFVLLRELVQNDIYVYALCRENSSRISRIYGLENVEVLKVDLNCPEKIKELNKIIDCDIFYHLAWEGERNNFHQQYKNIEISLKCLSLASELGCKRFICTGSQAEYGKTLELITEETPLKPNTAYGSCKAAAYYLTSDLSKRLNIEHTWVRIFSTYGPTDNHNSLIIKLIADIKHTGNAILITNGKHIWNYLYEDDVGRALRLLGINNYSTGVFNLASSICKPLSYFVEELKEIIRPDATITYGTEESTFNLNVTTMKILKNIGEFENFSFNEGIKRIITANNDYLFENSICTR